MKKVLISLGCTCLVLGALPVLAQAEGLSESLAEQICNVTGGPCKYTGANMKKAHIDMKIKKSDFNAVVEGLQDAMTAHNIPFRVQNQLLARLAPMHRDVITVH